MKCSKCVITIFLKTVNTLKEFLLTRAKLYGIVRHCTVICIFLGPLLLWCRRYSKTKTVLCRRRYSKTKTVLCRRRYSKRKTVLCRRRYSKRKTVLCRRRYSKTNTVLCRRRYSKTNTVLCYDNSLNNSPPFSTLAFIKAFLYVIHTPQRLVITSP